MVDSRWSVPPNADERTLLGAFLDYHRDALLRKCADLTDEQLRKRPVASSALSLIGLVRHLAGVERWYFRAIMAGAFPGSLYADEFGDTAGATRAATFADWHAEVAESRRIAASLPLEAVGRHPETGHEHSLRWVLTHMVDEYARHNGHADLLREAIDGRTGE